jgi:hypothetical protein
VDDDGGAVRAIDLEPPSLENEPVTAIEGDVLVRRRYRARRRIEREPLHPRDRFRDAERDRQVGDQGDDQEDRDEIRPELPCVSQDATNVSLAE